MTYTQKPKIAGNPCEQCGAKLVLSPKTGKIFCEKKCWLNKPQGHPTQDTQDDVIQVPENKPDWDSINAKKEQGMAHLNAKNNATAIIVALIGNSGLAEFRPAEVISQIKLLTKEIEQI